MRVGAPVSMSQYNALNERFNTAKSQAHGLGNVIENAKARAAADHSRQGGDITDAIKDAKKAAEDAGEAVTEAAEGAAQFFDNPQVLAAAAVALIIVMVVLK